MVEGRVKYFGMSDGVRISFRGHSGSAVKNCMRITMRTRHRRSFPESGTSSISGGRSFASSESSDRPNCGPTFVKRGGSLGGGASPRFFIFWQIFSYLYIQLYESNFFTSRAHSSSVTGRCLSIAWIQNVFSPSHKKEGFYFFIFLFMSEVLWADFSATWTRYLPEENTYVNYALVSESGEFHQKDFHGKIYYTDLDQIKNRWWNDYYVVISGREYSIPLALIRNSKNIAVFYDIHWVQALGYPEFPPTISSPAPIVQYEVYKIVRSWSFAEVEIDEEGYDLRNSLLIARARNNPHISWVMHVVIDSTWKIMWGVKATDFIEFSPPPSASHIPRIRKSGNGKAELIYDPPVIHLWDHEDEWDIENPNIQRASI